MHSCVPKNFFYDDQTRQSSNKVMEMHGYSNPISLKNGMIPMESSVAYKINEPFLGYQATQVIIPRRLGGGWSIIINAPAEKLANAIYLNKKEKVKIYTVEDKASAPPRIAYIVDKGFTSELACFLMEGED